jgi:hypothetical protein
MAKTIRDIDVKMDYGSGGNPEVADRHDRFLSEKKSAKYIELIVDQQ